MTFSTQGFSRPNPFAYRRIAVAAKLCNGSQQADRCCRRYSRTGCRARYLLGWRSMKPSVSRLLAESWKGAVAGFAATAPMTVVMWGLDRSWRVSEQKLPPEQITRNIARRTGLSRFLDRGGKKAASWGSHFGYGTAGGAAYPLTVERLPASPAVKGPLYGLLIWALSYLGWLPAAGIMAPSTRQSRRRNIALVSSHVIWGLTCAVLYACLHRPGATPSSIATSQPQGPAT
jgi:hypothetical protein